jgi:GT2 family glycosyltransferase
MIPESPPAPEEPAAWPRVAVLILNYNGWRYMPACLEALAATDYPAGQLEIVVIDNASSDGTVAQMRARYPEVRTLALSENTGFSGGNNAGIRATDTPYVVLLNNDTAVDPGWLKPLVRAAESDPRVGGCGAKLLYFYADLPLQVRVERSFVPARDLPGNGDGRVLGVRLAAAALSGDSIGAQVGYASGWYDREGSGPGAYRWSSDAAVLNLPVGAPNTALEVRLSFAGGPPAPLQPAVVRLAIGDTVLHTVEVGAEPAEVTLAIPAELTLLARRAIQNAGTELLPGGYCRDRGSYVEDGVERHAFDGAYERQEEVFGLCGAALLLRRAMLDEIGLLDDRFFMYYEDIDLCWRGRFAGWRFMYVPAAVVRHIHSGSSGEWSPLFRFHVERNRLLMLLKNAPRPLAARAVGGYVADTGRWIWRSLRALRQGRRSAAASWAFARNNSRVLASLLRAAPAVLGQRRRIRRQARINDAVILGWMVKP